MKKKKATSFFTLVCAGWFGASSLLYQGCAGPTNLSAPASAPTPTPVPSDVTFIVANSSGNITVWEMALLNNSNGLSDYVYCSVPPGSTLPVTASLPSGSGSYQVTVDCNVSGYCRKAVCSPVNLTVGSTCNISISQNGAVMVGSVSCPSLSGC